MTTSSYTLRVPNFHYERGHYHLRYPSDLTDQEWEVARHVIPPAKRGGRKREINEREVVNAILYILGSNCPWRALPKDLPPRSTVYDYLARWQRDGTLDRMHHDLSMRCREQAGRDASPTAAVIDSQSVKNAEKGGPASTRRATTRARRSTAASGASSSTRKAC